MKRQTENQKGFSPIPVIIVVVGVIIVLVAVFLFTQKAGLPALVEIKQPTQAVPAIQSASDLNNVSSDLDDADMGQFDKELNQLDTDAATF
mgnify:CR=1 FL=1